MTAKKYLLLLILLMSAGFGASAQYNPWWQWARADTMAALNASGGGSVLATKGGKTLWGYMTANQTVVNGTVMGTWTLFEYDSMGVRKGAAAFGGKVELIDAQADAAGNWYVLGRFYDSLVLPGSTIVRTNPSSNTDPDHFMFRLDGTSMYMRWFRPLSSVNGVSSRAFTTDNSKIIIAADSTDATYVRSISFATGAYSPMFRQGGRSVTTSVQADAAGNIYLAGSCATGAIDFNGTVQPSPRSVSHAYLVKYGPGGAYRWHYWLNDPVCAQRKLTLYKDRFLFYTGTLQDSLTLGPVSLHPPLKSMDYISARLDTAGGVTWVQRVDTLNNGEASLGEQAFHAVVTPDTALVMFAQGHTYLNWGDNITTDLFGTYSSVVVSRGSAGETRWARPVLADNSSDAHVVTEGDAVWVCGNAFTNSAFIRMDTLNLRVSARNWVPYMAKLRLKQPPFIKVNGVGSVTGEMLHAVPNPAHGVVKITGLSGHSTITLQDISGRSVRRLTAEGGEAVMNIADVAAGIYFLHMRNGSGVTETRKLMVQ